MRCIKHYVRDLCDETYMELIEICRMYSKIRNIIYNKYGGIRSIGFVYKDATKLRKEAMELLSYYNLPYKFKESAFYEAIANIKSMWSNVFNKIRKNVKNNENLTSEQTKLLYICLKHPSYIHKLMNGEEIKPELVKNIDLKKTFNYLRRQLTKYSTKPFSKKKRTFVLVENCYKLDNGVLFIQGLIKGKRLKLQLTDDTKFDKEIRIVVNESNRSVEVHTHKKLKSTIEYKDVSDLKQDEVIGIDKNYQNVISTSNGNVYGDGFNKLLYQYSTYVTKSESTRQRFRMQIKKCEAKLKDDKLSIEEKDLIIKKIQNIYENNLSSKKYDNRKSKYKSSVECLVNRSLNEFMNKEKPKYIAQEYLGFVSKKKKKTFKKDHSHSINNWTKGVINKRLTFKCLERGVQLMDVNAAATSMCCSKCGNLQERSNTKTFNCKKCGTKTDVHINSANNVKQRLFDKEIDLYTSSSRVIKIIKERNEVK